MIAQIQVKQMLLLIESLQLYCSCSDFSNVTKKYSEPNIQVCIDLCDGNMCKAVFTLTR